MNGPSPCRCRPLWAGVVCSLAAAAVAAAPQAAPIEHVDVQFALVRYAGGNWNPRPNGLPRLAWEIRKRTSIAIGLEVAAVEPAAPDLFKYPMLVWQGDAAFPPLPAAAVTNLQAHLGAGGSLLVDVSDAAPEGPFATCVRRELGRIFPDQPLQRVPAAHVVYKSFYLLDRHGGRVLSRPYLEGLRVEGRLAVIVSANDLAGAVARSAFGDWEYEVGGGGLAAREMTFRLGVNWLMYALCLDYKEDQVHIPFILQRRR